MGKRLTVNITKEILEDLYIEKGKSPQEIAHLLNQKYFNIYYYFNKYGIRIKKRRNRCLNNLKLARIKSVLTQTE